MKTTSRLITALRVTAAILFLAGVGTWVATGAHRGWTQTSKVTLKQDEVTGIEYPVREPAFVAGVELLGAAVAGAVALGAAGQLLRRRHGARA